MSLLAAYSTLAEGGMRRPIRDVVRVLNAHHETRFDVTSPIDQLAASRFRVDGLIRAAAERNKRALSANNAYIMQTALERVITKGTARKGRIRGLGLAEKQAQRICTTPGLPDFQNSILPLCGWVMTATKERSGAVRPASRASLPIWHRWMKAVHSASAVGDLPLDKPEGVVQRVVDPRSGLWLEVSAKA